jgi:hypothetical protein
MISRLLGDVRRFVSEKLRIFGTLSGAEANVTFTCESARVNRPRSAVCFATRVNPYGVQTDSEQRLHPIPHAARQWRPLVQTRNLRVLHCMSGALRHEVARWRRRGDLRDPIGLAFVRIERRSNDLVGCG